MNYFTYPIKKENQASFILTSPLSIKILVITYLEGIEGPPIPPNYIRERERISVNELGIEGFSRSFVELKFMF